MIRLQCDCGQKLKTGPESAGRFVRCPKCQAKLKVPDAVEPPAAPPQAAAGAANRPSPRPPAGSRPASPPVAPSQPASTKPGATAAATGAAPMPLPVELDDFLSPPAPKSGQSAADDELLDFADPPPPPTPYSGSILVKPVPASGALGYARDPAAKPHSRYDKGVIVEPTVGFWFDALKSFAYPFASTGNTINFIIIAVVSILKLFLSLMPAIGLWLFATKWWLKLIVFGWLAAAFMNIVAEVCSGNDDMPNVTMEDGIYGDVIVPAFRFIATFALAMAPAIAFLVLDYFGLIPQTPWAGIMGFAWLAIGVFAWPMIMLMFSLGVGEAVFRVDLMITTLFRALLPYLAIWLVLLLLGALSVMTSFGFLLRFLGMGNPLGDLMSMFVAALIIDVIGTYLWIVALRTIGLYYRHYKHRFAFKLE